jgi:SAM-dependent methyltransferase
MTDTSTADRISVDVAETDGPRDDALRKASERDFHNQRFGDEHDSREHLDKWYEALAACYRAQDEQVRRWGKGARVLEYGCADGKISLGTFDLKNDFGSYHGIDISDKAIEHATRKAARLGLANCAYSVMDAEKLTFPDESFDVVFGRGILHHLDLKRCYGEIARVLKSGGKAFFNEPLGHNPALNWYRNRTPDLRTPDEHPLLMSDFDLAKSYFATVECKFFGLATVAGVPFRKTPLGSPLMKLLENTDRLLLSVPFVKQNAWSVLMVLTRA